MSERAVSEVLGFILVFSFITLTVGIVSVTGFAGLEEQRNAEKINNAERAFEILADNIEDIYRRGAPQRSTEIGLAGARLSSAGATTVEVSITNLAQPSNVRVLNPIKYSAPDGTTLVYENGAVIREDPNGGAVMKREPNLVFSDRGGTETAILPIVPTSAARTSIAGDTTALVRTVGAGSAVLDRHDDPVVEGVTQYDVQLTIETSPGRAVVWWRYLNEEIEAGYSTPDACGTSPPGGDTVTCAFSVDQVSITSSRIDVGFA